MTIPVACNRIFSYQKCAASDVWWLDIFAFNSKIFFMNMHLTYQMMIPLHPYDPVCGWIWNVQNSEWAGHHNGLNHLQEYHSLQYYDYLHLAVYLSHPFHMGHPCNTKVTLKCHVFTIFIHFFHFTYYISKWAIKQTSWYCLYIAKPLVFLDHCLIFDVDDHLLLPAYHHLQIIPTCEVAMF